MINKILLNEVVEEIKKQNLTLGAVESFTGGLFSSSLTSVSGVSSIFKGSIVSYSTQIKEDVVGVDKNIIEKDTVVSSSVAQEMAQKGSEILKTDITVSFTGNAGPTVCEGDKPVGLTYICIYFRKKFFVYENLSNADRNGIREAAVNFALKKIKKILEKI